MTSPASTRDPSARKTVVVSGSTGLIGSAAVHAFELAGYVVRRLVRRPARADGEISWDPERETIDSPALEGADVVLHLAGENLAQRWTEEVKRRIRESRAKGTATLSAALASLARKPTVMLSGSAVGAYGRHRDDTVDETSSLGDDFLASVCKEWEAATAPATAAGIRVVHLRTGLIVSRDGGVVGKLLLPFRLGIGGQVGSGQQWMSWISMPDYLEALALLMDATSISGPVNVVAPNPVTNEEFTRLLARVLRRPALFTIPRAAMSLALGEMAEGTVLASQRVRPRRLLEAGFIFNQPTLEGALRAELTRSTR